MTTYVVAVYLADRVFGGPEEGGWWYNTGSLVRTIRRFKSEDRACEYADRMNQLLAVTLNKGRRPKWSVISDGVYEAAVYDNEAPAEYPEVRPHYE